MLARLAPALRLRLLVLRRRHGTPLEAVILALLLLAGHRLGAARPDLAPAGAAAVAWAALLAATGAARRGLGLAPELVWLRPAGVDGPALVALRALELACAVAPFLAVAGAAQVGAAEAGASGALGAALAAAGLALGLASAAAAIAARPGLGRTTSVLAAGLAALAAADVGAAREVALAPGALLAAAGGLAPPGGLASPAAVAASWAAAALAGAAALALAPARVDAPGPGPARAGRGEGPRPGAFPAGPVAALARRDLRLLLRGRGRRGLLVVLVVGAAGATIAHAVARDPGLAPRMLALAQLLVTGVVATAVGHWVGVDLPRERRRELLLERTSPASGRDVARARALLGVPAAGALALAVAGAALAGAPPGALDPRDALFACVTGPLLAALVVLDGVAHGLEGEPGGDPAHAAAWPLRAAALVVALSIALALHPLLVVLHPVLGYAGHAAACARRWARAPLELDAPGAP